MVTHSQSHSQTQSKGKKTDVSLSSSTEEIEDGDGEIVDPIILVPSTKDKEPLDHRSNNAIEDEEPEANRTMVPQQTMPMPQ